jgi:hypothetical protein
VKTRRAALFLGALLVLPGCTRETAGGATQAGTLASSPEAAFHWTLPTAPAPVRASAKGRTYYVDGARGNDANDGRSEEAAFRTLGRAVSESNAPLEPGDRVLVKAGVYRERLAIRKSGTPTAPIVISAAGDGEVVVDASALVEDWSQVTGEVFRARPGFRVTAVVVDQKPLLPDPDIASMVEGRYHQDGGGDLYVWCPGGASPASHEVAVVKDDEYQDGLALADASDVVLYGITVRFAGGNGFSVLGNRVRIERCRALFNGKAGISVFGYGTTASADVAVVGSEIYHNVLRNWPRGRYKWGGWSMGAVSHGTPGVRFEGNVSHRNGGEGLGAYAGPGGSVFRDNVVFDNWSVNIYVDNQPNATVENNLVYCNTPDPADLHGNGDPDPSDQRNLRRLRAEGIMTADEKYSLDPPSNLHDVLVANNLILDCRRGFDHYAQATGSGLKRVRVLFNTIVVPDADGPGEAYVGIRLPWNDGHNADSVFENNLVYARFKSTYVLSGGNPERGSVDAFAGVRLDHNLWFHARSGKPFHWGPDGPAFDFSHADWATQPGAPHAEGDVAADPRLKDPASFDPPSLAPIDTTSPAVDKGTDAGIDEDYTHGRRPVGGGFDIGALEVGAAAGPAKKR